MPEIRNPVLPGFYPDPSVCRVGSDYYLVTSSFEYVPAVPVFHSTDLQTWRQIGHCIDRPEQLDLRGRPSSAGIFAPTLRFHDGIFYMITTDVGGIGHFYVTAQDPAGPWSDPIRVEGPGFDPDLFFDVDGTVYFTREDITGHGIRQWQIDITTGKLLGPERLIWEGLEDRLCEAPHIYRIDGTYYLLVAEGGTWRGHMAVIARGATASGPFESCPHNPILTHRHRVLSPVQSTGHGDLVQTTDGRWWMLFLATRPVGKWHHLGRETFLAPVEWIDGWPHVNGGDEITVSDSGAGIEYPRGVTRAGSLLPPWNARGVLDTRFVPGAPSTDHDGITLIPSTTAIGDTGGSAFIGRRQTRFDGTFSVQMDAMTLGNAEEAGIVALMDERHHARIGVTRRMAGEIVISVRQTVGDLSSNVYEEVLPSSVGNMHLRITSSAQRYAFYYRRPNDDSWQSAGEAETRLLSAEVAGSFTGVYLGMYAYAEQSSQSRVTFSEVIYQ